MEPFNHSIGHQVISTCLALFLWNYKAPSKECFSLSSSIERCICHKMSGWLWCHSSGTTIIALFADAFHPALRVKSTTVYALYQPWSDDNTYTRISIDLFPGVFVLIISRSCVPRLSPLINSPRISIQVQLIISYPISFSRIYLDSLPCRLTPLVDESPESSAWFHHFYPIIRCTTSTYSARYFIKRRHRLHPTR